MDMNIPLKLSRFIKPGKVFVFSTSYCPYCVKAKELLDSYEIKWESVTVDSDPDLRSDNEFVEALHKHSKINTYPKIYIGTDCVGGYTDLYKLSQNMKLFSLLKNEKIKFADDDAI